MTHTVYTHLMSIIMIAYSPFVSNHNVSEQIICLKRFRNNDIAQNGCKQCIDFLVYFL